MIRNYGSFQEMVAGTGALNVQDSVGVFNAALQRDTGLPDRFVGENDLSWQFTELTKLGEKLSSESNNPQDLSDVKEGIEENWQSLLQNVAAGEADLEKAFEQAKLHNRPGQIEDLKKLAQNYYIIFQILLLMHP